MASPVPGLTMIAGGKYTTYRIMAKDAVDAVVPGLNRIVPRVLHRGRPAARRRRLSRRSGTRPQAAGRALRAPGHPGRAPAQPLRLADLRAVRADRGRPRPRTTAGLSPGVPQGRGRLRRLARGRAAPGRHPGPAYPDLDRDLGPRPRRRRRGGRPGRSGARLGRRRRRPRGRATTSKRVAAERESQHQPDDLSADAARLGAPDVRTGAADLDWSAPLAVSVG